VSKLFPLFFAFSCFAAFAQEGDLHTSTLTLGVGGMPYSYNPGSGEGGGSTFTGNYEYRLSKNLAVEGGADIFLSSRENFEQVSVILPGQNLITVPPNTPIYLVPVTQQNRIALVTYGLKGILPLAHDRLELYAGIGGAYAWNSEYNGGLNAALGQASLGARLALDRGHRFWLGTTLRGYSNFGGQAWLPWTINLGIRFGH
jgi:hypothetical protein